MGCENSPWQLLCNYVTQDRNNREIEKKKEKKKRERKKNKKKRKRQNKLSNY